VGWENIHLQRKQFLTSGGIKTRGNSVRNNIERGVISPMALRKGKFVKGRNQGEIVGKIRADCQRRDRVSL